MKQICSKKSEIARQTRHKPLAFAILIKEKRHDIY